MAITYQALYNQIIPTIASFCWNVVNYNGMPSEFKSGYTYTTNVNRVYARWTIRNPIPFISQDTLTNDFLYYIRTVRGIDLNATATKRGIMHFYSAVAAFCTIRVRVAMSQVYNVSRPSGYLVYIRDGGYGNFQNFGNGDTNNIPIAYDMSAIANTVTQIITTNARAYVVRYNTSIWAG